MESSSFAYRECVTLDFANAYHALRADAGWFIGRVSWQLVLRGRVRDNSSGLGSRGPVRPDSKRAG